MDKLPFAKKSLGQHWLTDSRTLLSICEAADITSADTVLEIGPGIGTLTAFLTSQAKRVVAVEFDKTLAQALPGQVSAPNLEVIHQDIIKFDLTSLPADYKIVANIPYYLTSHLLRIISETSNLPKLVALLVQKEVAERVTAEPGSMSLLSVSAQFYWEVKKGIVVKSNMFTPPPKVDSQVLILKRRNKPLFTGVDEKIFFRLIRAGFSARRKTLLNSLSGGLRTGKREIDEILRVTGLEPNLRPQALSLPEWHSLYQAAIKQNIL